MSPLDRADRVLDACTRHLHRDVLDRSVLGRKFIHAALIGDEGFEAWALDHGVKISFRHVPTPSGGAYVAHTLDPTIAVEMKMRWSDSYRAELNR